MFAFGCLIVGIILGGLLEYYSGRVGLKMQIAMAIEDVENLGLKGEKYVKDFVLAKLRKIHEVL